MSSLSRPRVGVLALQGDVPEHAAAVERVLGEESVVPVLGPADLLRVSALLLPGGESTTLSRLLDEEGLRAPLKERLEGGLPALATCAGLILLARELEPSPGGRDPETLGLLSVKVRRNDYGRQVESFEAPVDLQGLSGGPFPAAFIRAPRILRVDTGVEVLGSWDGSPVAVRQGNLWGLTFHPELSSDERLHRLFLRSHGLLP